jgi:antitoxin component of MazEF toxin-antitoxin module
MSKHNTIARRVGGSTLTAIPPQIVRALGLKPGDPIDWERHGDIAILKFYRATTIVTPAQAVEEQRMESP